MMDKISRQLTTLGDATLGFLQHILGCYAHRAAEQVGEEMRWTNS